MAAATADRRGNQQDGDVVSYPVAASTTLFLDSLINLDSAGNAVSATDSATDLGFVGVAIEGVNNSAGAAGDLRVKVRRTGVWEFVSDATQTLVLVGTLMYVVDNQTVDLVGVTTNDILVGRIVQFDPDASATLAIIQLMPFTGPVS